MTNFPWKTIIVTGGISAAAGILYYLLRSEKTVPETKIMPEAKKTFDLDSCDTDQVVEILSQLVKDQENLKLVMKDLTAEIIQNNYSCDEAYRRIVEINPQDPFELAKISPADLDYILESLHEEPGVQECVSKLMGFPGNLNLSPKVHTLTKQTIVNVHEFMLKELKSISEEFKNLPYRNTYDPKLIAITAQALVVAKTEKEFQLSSDDVEAATILHYQQLSVDQDFASCNIRMQAAVASLVEGLSDSKISRR